MNALDVAYLEGVFRAMRAHGVQSLKVGDMEISIPFVLPANAPTPHAEEDGQQTESPIAVGRDGVLVVDPDLLSASGR